MVEAVCSKRSTLRVAGEEAPRGLVRSRLLKLGREHIRYILDCLEHNTTQVRNVRQYLLTTLYNASLTMVNGVTASWRIWQLFQFPSITDQKFTAFMTPS